MQARQAQVAQHTALASQQAIAAQQHQVSAAALHPVVYLFAEGVSSQHYRGYAHLARAAYGSLLERPYQLAQLCSSKLRLPSVVVCA